MNHKIREGFELYEAGRSVAALKVFEDIMESGYDNYSPVFGTLFLYMISIHNELGQSKEARRIFNELKESAIVGREEFINTARDTGLVR